MADARAGALARDGGCVYPRWLSSNLGADTLRDWCAGPLEFDHVADSKAMGAKGPDRADHGQIVCAHHHKDGWATAKEIRAWARERLDDLHPDRHTAAGCTGHPLTADGDQL